MMATKGSRLITSVEMLMLVSWSAVSMDRQMPKTKDETPTHRGLPLASMAMTMAMNPWPWVIKGERARPDDREVRAAEPGKRSGGEYRVRPDRQHVDARRV